MGTLLEYNENAQYLTTTYRKSTYGMTVIIDKSIYLYITYSTLLLICEHVEIPAAGAVTALYSNTNSQKCRKSGNEKW